MYSSKLQNMMQRWKISNELQSKGIHPKTYTNYSELITYYMKSKDEYIVPMVKNSKTF